MDISVNGNVEKVKFRDILNMFFGNNSSIDDGALKKEIDEIFEVEKETGGTANIAALVNRIQTPNIEKIKTKRKSTKVLNKKPEIKVESKVIEDEERDI